MNSLQNQRSTIRMSKNFLRNERSATARSIESADPPAKVSLSRRVAEIDDQLKDLELDDQEVGQAIKALRPGR